MARVRGFKEEDAEVVAKLSNANSHLFQFPHVTPEFLKNFTDHPKFQMFVIEECKRITGFCGVNFENPREAELGPICVEEGKRSQGLGTMLVNEIFQFLKPRNPEKIIIKVKASNMGGQKFFEKLGFEALSGDICCGEPAILMGREYGL